MWGSMKINFDSLSMGLRRLFGSHTLAQLIANIHHGYWITEEPCALK